MAQPSPDGDARGDVAADSGDPTDAALVTRCLNGQREAFEELFDRHGPRIYNIVYRLCGNPTEAEDLTQETFLRAFTTLHTLRQPQAFAGWLSRIATNTSLGILRRRRSLAFVELSEEVANTFPDDSHWQSPQDVVLTGDDRQAVRATLERLVPSQRVALALREVEGLSYADIARTLGVSSGAVEVLIFRARRRFREQYEAVAAGAGARQGAAPAVASCRRVRSSLAVVLDGEGNDEQRAATLAHVRGCTMCQNEIAVARATRTKRAVLPLLPLSAAVKAGVLARLVPHGAPLPPPAPPGSNGPTPPPGSNGPTPPPVGPPLPAAPATPIAPAVPVVPLPVGVGPSAGGIAHFGASALGVKVAALLTAKAALIAASLTATALIAGGALALHSWARPRQHPVSIAAPHSVPTSVGARPVGTPPTAVSGLSHPVRATVPSPLHGRASVGTSHPLAHIIQGQPSSRSGGSGSSKSGKGANPPVAAVKSSRHASPALPRVVGPVSGQQKPHVASGRPAVAHTGVGAVSPTHRPPATSSRTRARGHLSYRPAAGHRAIGHAGHARSSHARLPHGSVMTRSNGHARYARGTVRIAPAHGASRRHPFTSPRTARPVSRIAVRRHRPIPARLWAKRPHRSPIVHHAAKRPHRPPVAHHRAKRSHRSPIVHRGTIRLHRSPVACYWRTIPGRPVYAGRWVHGRSVIVMIRRQPSRRVFWCGGR